MQVVLVMFRSDGERRSFSVVRNMTVIGRREDCDLRIPVGDVSRKHCRLVRTDDGIRIEDLGSSNGTFVNGQRIQESELNPGDQIGVGPVQFVVQINGVPDDAQILAPAPPEFDPEATNAGLAPPPSPHPQPLEELEAPSLEEVPLEEVSAEAAALERIAPLDEPPLEEFPIEEAELEEVPPAPSPAPRPMPSPKVARPSTPAAVPPPPPPAMPEQLSVEEHHEELEELQFEEAPAAKHAELEHVELEAPAPQPAAEGDWDFVVDEHEAEHTGEDFHIDLDSPHEQPHK